MREMRARMSSADLLIKSWPPGREVSKIRSLILLSLECDFYTKEFLEPKADRLGTKMLDEMMDRYQGLDEDEDDGLKDSEQDAPLKVDRIESDDVDRNVSLPSIQDSKLWRVAVTPGRERELVLKITNKLIDHINHGNPLNVLEVFECQLSQGVVYCEAFKIQHVEKVVQGLSGVNMRSIKMIPINEMTEVMKGC